MSQSAEERFGAEETMTSREGEPRVVGADKTSEATISPRAHSQTKEMRLLASLFILELSLAVMAIAMYMKGARPFVARQIRPPPISALPSIGKSETSSSRSDALIPLMNTVSYACSAPFPKSCAST